MHIMSQYDNIHVLATTKKALEKKFRPRETWDELVQRIMHDSDELTALKSLLSPKQLAELQSRIRKNDPEAVEVLAQ